jgi:deferrochelatase/peroxidase EfeB
MLGLTAGAAGLATVDARGSTPDTAPVQPLKPALPLTIPFHGPHQAGIVTPQPFAGLIASFDVLVETRDDLRQLCVDLTRQFQFLARGGRPEDVEAAFPPVDNGLLGPAIEPERLTATLSFGASLFDGRFGLAPLKPRQLVVMPEFANDALDEGLCHGDLAIQFCAETPEETIHALRSVLKMTADRLVLNWKQEGFTSTHGSRRGVTGTGRNLLGFKDGTANADVGNEALMNDYVWVGAGSGEPDWATNGSYQVVRLIRSYVEFWDRTPLGEQETIIGRHKDTGAPLGGREEFDPIDYASDPEGKRIPLDAHIRLANPRTAKETARLLRRGFNYSNGMTKAGQLDMGLMFIAYQSDLDRGFASAQSRLNGEPLEEYIKPFGGGYFFALPGVSTPQAFLGEPLFAAAQSLPLTNQPAEAGTHPDKG